MSMARIAGSPRRSPAVPASAAAPFELRLYVSGGAPNSLRAIANLEALQRAHERLARRVEVVDVFVEPERAQRDAVLLTPMLVKLAPGGPVRIVGDLSDTQTVLSTLGLANV